MLAALSDAHIVVIAVGVGGDVDIAVVVAQAADRYPAVIIPRIARGGISERQQLILAAFARDLVAEGVAVYVKGIDLKMTEVDAVALLVVKIELDRVGIDRLYLAPVTPGIRGIGERIRVFVYIVGIGIGA